MTDVVSAKRRNTNALFAASLLFFPAASSEAQAQTAGWPDTIDLLAQERSQAEACVALMKDSADPPTIAEARIAYNAAKAAADGAIAGLTIALVQGYKPENLPRVQANLERAGTGLQEVCDAAAKAARSAAGARGPVDQIVTAAVAPAIDALKSATAALWSRHVENDKVEQEAIKTQLESAKWPDF
jgi:hypothetical protein